MKVFNLRCGANHAFEGWFASEEDYVSQTERGLLECPVCGDRAVHKLPSAPRLNLGTKPVAPAVDSSARAATDDQDSATKSDVTSVDPLLALQAAYLQFARHVAQHTENVGERFAEEARKIHYGESEERGIRGKTSPKEAAALLEEGISVIPLLLPEGIEGPLQ